MWTWETLGAVVVGSRDGGAAQDHIESVACVILGLKVYDTCAIAARSARNRC